MITITDEDTIPYGEFVKALAEAIVEILRPYSKRIKILGSLRRKKENPHDIDIAIIPKNKDDLIDVIMDLGDKKRAGRKLITLLIGGVSVDFYFAKSKNFGAMMLHLTGSGEFNRVMRGYAKKSGYKLNQYGLFDRTTDELIASRSEKAIFDALGLKLIPPQRRIGSKQIIPI